MTCADAVKQLDETFGYMGNFQDAITIQAADPMAKAAAIMERFFSEPPRSLADVAVETIHDYLHSQTTDLTTGKTTPIDMSPDRVIAFGMADGSRVTVRPSGTEPLIKFYYAIPCENKEAALLRKNAYKAAVSELLN